MDLATLLQFFPEPVRPLISGKDISDIMLNEDGKVFIDRGGMLVEQPFTVDARSVLIGVQNIARRLGSDIDEHRPILDSRLPDGSRVAAVYGHKALTVTIRKFNRWYSTDELVATGCLSRDIRDGLVSSLLGWEIRGKANILVSGGTSSGKSTFAKALLDHVPLDERLIVIEKPRELAISHPNAVRWEASDGVPGGAPPVTVGHLVTAALRHRPDRIIIGEVREPSAAYELLQVMNTGHSGTIATIHADSAEDAIYRMTDLVLAAQANLTHQFVERQVLRSLDYVVHLVRIDGQRRVREVCSVTAQGAVQVYPVREKEND